MGNGVGRLSILNAAKAQFSRKSARKDPDLVLLLDGGFDSYFYSQQLGGGIPGGMRPVEHYHSQGWRLGLDPCSWFSTAAYINTNPDVRAANTDPFLHYIKYGRAEGRPARASSAEPDVPDAISELTIPLVSGENDLHAEVEFIRRNMDAEFYAKQMPHMDFSVIDPATHYHTIGWRIGLDPCLSFSTIDYLQSHGDVRAAGIDPFVHFLKNGNTERRTNVGSRLSSTRPGNPAIPNAWEGYNAVSLKELETLEKRGGDVQSVDFTVTLSGADLFGEISRLRLPASENARISVVIPCWNQSIVTAECLMAVFQCAHECALEIIVVDNGSNEPFFKELPKHPDIGIVHFEKNIGFGPACNAGAKVATGEFIFFLNNDAQIAPGCLTNLLAVMEEEPLVGAVGPKILSFDGSLQEAGALLNPDGTAHLMGFGFSPDVPRFQYRRSVEHISGAALLIRKELFLAVGGFDDVYAPAYCEDADLSLKLRQRGLSIVYEPSAVVAHHLSKTTNDNNKKSTESDGARTKRQLIAKNRATLIRRWSKPLLEFDIRTIAFYLPQYHPVPENDRWWGKGFTEWRNLGKASPNFIGHRQPRVPADLGYYDLRVEDVLEQQADLARRYGVTGFCYYYYWFAGKKILEMPLERMLRSGRPDLPFCLCWANENWTRRWDGQSQDILLKQEYGDLDALAFANDTLPYFEMDHYIRVNDRPLFLIYRAQEIPNSKRFFDTCRNVWRRAGHDVVIALVESFELSASPQPPEKYGADLTVEFPAHGMVHDAPMPVRRTNPDWNGNAHDYRELAKAFMTRVEPGFKRLRSVLVGWDTTPRHPNASLVLQRATPGAFQAWLEWTYRRTREQNFGDERIVFVNAWNEWCEGSYLEPDTHFGHAYLEAVRNAQDAALLGRQTFEEL